MAEKEKMKYTVDQIVKMKEFQKYSSDYLRALLPNSYYTLEEATKIIKNYFKE